MKKKYTMKLTGAMILGSLLVTTTTQAQPAPMDAPYGNRIAAEGGPQPHPPFPGPGVEMNRPPRTGPGRIVGRLLNQYDADLDGQLAGLELSNTAIDLVVRRSRRPLEAAGEAMDLKALAHELEEKLIRDFDIDDSGGLSAKELIIALEAIHPHPPVFKGKRKTE